MVVLYISMVSAKFRDHRELSLRLSNILIMDSELGMFMNSSVIHPLPSDSCHFSAHSFPCCQADSTKLHTANHGESIK